MHTKQHILFDLDGTLTDPFEGITNSILYALEAFGIALPKRQSLRAFIGPPLKDSFMAYYGFDDKGAQAAIAKYREYYAQKGIFENNLYEGVPAMLKALGESGREIILATSKPTIYARQILEHFGIDGAFSHACGSELDGTRAKKGEVIAYALGEAHIASPDAAVMIGDREHDILGAGENGMDSIGVLYGYGTRTELSDAGASQIVATVGELTQALLE